MTDTNIAVLKQQDLHDLDYITTDSGNADRLIREYGRDFRYCEPLGGWLHWNGVRWQVENAAIWEKARDIGKALLHEAADANDKNNGDRLWQHGRFTLSESGMRKMIALAVKDSRVRVGPELFDSNPYLLNCLNGTIDVCTGKLRDHDRTDLITKLAPVSYDPKAKAPTWYRFVKRVLPKPNVRRYVRKATGQALTGIADEQAFYLNQGVGDNGKNTYFDTLITLLGDYAGTMDIEALMEKRSGGGATPELAQLKGKRFVVASESEENHRLKPALVKRLTGDKYIKARDLYKSPMEFERTHKLFMHVNHLPEISDTGYAMWKRVRFIHWEVRISAAEKDTHLSDKLQDELSGILNWALKGYRTYLDEGLEPPDEVKAATQRYRDDMDKVGQFIADRCVNYKPNLYVSKEGLYAAYQDWCEKNGVYAEKERKFGERMIERGFDKNDKEYIAGKQARVWRGISLLH
jgi:putative DNA primase/helicase